MSEKDNNVMPLATDPHNLGEFDNVYDAMRRYPNGGVDGDYIYILGVQHFWNVNRQSWGILKDKEDNLVQMVEDFIGLFERRGYVFAGYALPDTTPVSGLDNIFYIAAKNGVYTHFGSDLKLLNEVAILRKPRRSSIWIKDSMDIPNSERIDVIDDAISRINVDIETIKSAIIGMENDLDGVHDSIDDINKDIDAFKKETSENFEEVNSDLDKVEKRLDYIPKESFLSARPAGFKPDIDLTPEITVDRAWRDHEGNVIRDTYITRRGLRNEIIDITNQQVTDLKPGSVDPDDLSEATKQLIGNKSITNLPDEEDITVTDNQTLKLKDKEYAPKDYSGMGRVYLRKHYVNGVNTLTQHMMRKPNTIYIIQYDYCLAGQMIEVPENCVLDFQGGSLRNGTFKINDSSIIRNGEFCQKNRDTFFIDLIGDNITIENCKIYNESKSTMPVQQGTSIIYNQGGIAVRGYNCKVIHCDIYNFQGAGVYVYGVNDDIIENNIHDNCTGILCADAINTIIDGNSIIDNNINNAEAYDGILTTGEGLVITNNRVISSGEHGMYIHGSNITISNNFVSNNYFNGIKVGRCNNVIVDSNILENNNVSESIHESQIYVQQSFRNVTISNNTSIHKYGYFIRSWTDKDVSDDGALLICGNNGNGEINIYAKNDVLINNNISDVLSIGYADSKYQKIKGVAKNNNSKRINVVNSNNFVIEDNKSESIRISSSSYPVLSGNFSDNIIIESSIQIYIQNNHVGNIEIQDVSYLTSFLIGNYIKNQTTNWVINNIGLLKGNIIYYKIESSSSKDSLLIQSVSSPSKPSNGIVAIDNIFFSLGAKFLSLSSGSSYFPDNCIFTGNHFYNSKEALILYGEGHIVYNNVSDLSLTYCSVSNTRFIGNKSPIFFRDDLGGNFLLGNGKCIGGSNDRPHSMSDYQEYYDTDLEFPIWPKKGKGYLDAIGNPINSLHKGTTEKRPLNIKSGFFYYDTTLNKPIWWDGTNWVDATGATV